MIIAFLGQIAAQAVQAQQLLLSGQIIRSPFLSEEM
jgi:hypothetical protein